MGQEQSGSRRYAFGIFGGIVALSLVGCGTLSLLPSQSGASGSHFADFVQLETAYAKISTGTPASQLRGMGFDPSAGKAEVLSYLGVIERYMPTDSRQFDALAEPVKECLAARNRCSAMVFRPGGFRQAQTGNVVLNMLGFTRNTTDNNASAAVTLFVQDGRVAHKTISAGEGRQTALN